MTVKTREGQGWKVAEGKGGGTVPPLPCICEIEGTRVATAGDPMTAKAADFAVWLMRTQPGEECWGEVLRAAQGDGRSPSAQACAYESVPIDKLAHAGLRNKAPEVFTMIDEMMIGLEPLNTTAAWAVQNAVEDWERAATYYLQNYKDRWRAWVTPDAYEKINAALEKSS